MQVLWAPHSSLCKQSVWWENPTQHVMREGTSYKHCLPRMGGEKKGPSPRALCPTSKAECNAELQGSNSRLLPHVTQMNLFPTSFQVFLWRLVHLRCSYKSMSMAYQWFALTPPSCWSCKSQGWGSLPAVPPAASAWGQQGWQEGSWGGEEGTLPLGCGWLWRDPPSSALIRYMELRL